MYFFKCVSYLALNFTPGWEGRGLSRLATWRPYTLLLYNRTSRLITIFIFLYICWSCFISSKALWTWQRFFKQKKWKYPICLCSLMANYLMNCGTFPCCIPAYNGMCVCTGNMTKRSASSVSATILIALFVMCAVNWSMQHNYCMLYAGYCILFPLVLCFCLFSNRNKT